jgi:peptidoglycan/xylan/chitin deacetylase (PgdA/CDA1 family)
LPFKSTLLEPILGDKNSLAVGRISYSLKDGTVADDACYCGDMNCLPHLLNLMAKRQARVTFVKIGRTAADRKETAWQLHAEVVHLRRLSAE